MHLHGVVVSVGVRVGVGSEDVDVAAEGGGGGRPHVIHSRRSRGAVSPLCALGAGTLPLGVVRLAARVRPSAGNAYHSDKVMSTSMDCHMRSVKSAVSVPDWVMDIEMLLIATASGCLLNCSALQLLGVHRVGKIDRVSHRGRTEGRRAAPVRPAPRQCKVRGRGAERAGRG